MEWEEKTCALPGSVGLECWWCWNFNIAILQIKWYGVGNSPTSPRRHATNLFHLFWFLSSGPLSSLKFPTETAAKSCKNRAIFGPQNHWENPNEHPPLVEVVHPRASRVTRSRRSLSSPKYCWWAASMVLFWQGSYLCLIVVVVALILETKIKLFKKNLVQSLGDLEFAKPSCPFFPSSMITNPPSQLCVGWFLEPIGISQSSISRQIDIWRVHLLSPKNLSELKKFTNSEFEVSY